MDEVTLSITTETWASWKSLLRSAYAHAATGPDPSTQNAAVLVGTHPSLSGGGWALDSTWAANAFPVGVVQNAARWERPGKYAYVEHAERSAIYAAARLGIPTEGTAMVCTWAACPDCARAIILAGITTLVTHRQALDRSPDRWAAEIDTALEILTEAGVGIELIDARLDATPVRHSGEVWQP